MGDYSATSEEPYKGNPPVGQAESSIQGSLPAISNQALGSGSKCLPLLDCLPQNALKQQTWYLNLKEIIWENLTGT